MAQRSAPNPPAVGSDALFSEPQFSARGVWLPDAAQQEALRAAVEGRFQRLFAGGQLKERSSLVAAAELALDAVAAGSPADRILTILSAFQAQQDRDAASTTFGNIRWYQGDARIVDRNGIEFVSRKLALLWMLYGEQLTPAQRASLRSVLELAKEGIGRHKVPISYTNIWLMKTWNLIALGEGLQDEAVAKAGYGMLSDWLAYTRRTGINEYLSPSYYDVDLESLALIFNLSRSAQARQDARAGLDIIWHDIALNWFAPADRLGGTHSRDYNRLFNVGGLNRWLGKPLACAFGVVQPSERGEDVRQPCDAIERRAGKEGVQPRQGQGPYEALAWAPPPPEAAKWLQGPFPRLVSARWGEAPEKRHTHYLGRNFSIGSAESGYNVGHDNSPLVINLGSGQDVPVINFFMDGRRDHYGQNKTLEAGTGHMKALHMRPFLASVQREGEVLFAASVREDKPEYSALESVVTLPADAEYWLNDTRLELFRSVSRWNHDHVPNGSTTFIDVTQRDGKVELLLRDADERLGVGVSQHFAVQAGQTYRISASLQGGEVFLYLNYLDADKRLIGGEHAIKVRGGQDGFVNREFSFPAPEGAVWCKAWLYSSSANRTESRVNDLRFERLGVQPLVLGSFDFREYQPQSLSVPVGSTLFVRREDAVAALRLLGAWDLEGRSIGFLLHNDGLAWRALRLTATHAAERTNKRASLAMWAWAGEGFSDDAAFARQRQMILARAGTAYLRAERLRAEQGEMALELDLERGLRVLRRGHAELPDSAWSVNGQAWQP